MATRALKGPLSVTAHEELLVKRAATNASGVEDLGPVLCGQRQRRDVERVGRKRDEDRSFPWKLAGGIAFNGKRRHFDQSLVVPTEHPFV